MHISKQYPDMFDYVGPVSYTHLDVYKRQLEWQGSKDYARMGMDGSEQVVYYLLKTYPQLDASRVYTEGLSAGSATSTEMCIRDRHYPARGYRKHLLPAFAEHDEGAGCGAD